MKEIMFKIKFDDGSGYEGHGDSTTQLIKGGIENYLQIDLEDDDVIKQGWTVEVVQNI